MLVNSFLKCSLTMIPRSFSKIVLHDNAQSMTYDIETRQNSPQEPLNLPRLVRPCERLVQEQMLQRLIDGKQPDCFGHHPEIS